MAKHFKALRSFSLNLKLPLCFQLVGAMLAVSLALTGEGTSLAATGKTWSTFGGNPKMDEPNLSRMDLSGEVPPHPENYTWTVVPRNNSNSGTSAMGHVENSFTEHLAPRVIAFGTKIVPIHIKSYKNSMYYQFDNGSKELIWIEGVFLKIEPK